MTERSAGTTWPLAAVLLVGALSPMLDTSMVNIGISPISASLHITISVAQWVSTTYVVALGVTLPVSAWAARRVGSGNVWIYALAVFTASSAACAGAPNIQILLVFRVIQGASAGLFVPASQATLAIACPPAQIGRLMSIFGIGASTGLAIGPVLGSLVLNSCSWRGLFLVNIPIDLLALCVGAYRVPRGVRSNSRKPDLLGFVLVMCALPLLVYAVTTLGRLSATAVSAAMLSLGCGGLVAFCIRSWHVANPLIDIRLFCDRRYAQAVALSCLGGCALFSALLILPLYLQMHRNASIATTGHLMLSFGIGLAIASLVVGNVIDRFGVGIPLSLGNGLALFSIVLLVVTEPSVETVAEYSVFFAYGIATSFALLPSNVAPLVVVGASKLLDASVTVAIVTRVGGATVGALLTVVLDSVESAGTGGAFNLVFVALATLSGVGAVLALWFRRGENSRGVKPATQTREHWAFPHKHP